jgi:hypothetical protein
MFITLHSIYFNKMYVDLKLCLLCSLTFYHVFYEFIECLLFSYDRICLKEEQVQVHSPWNGHYLNSSSILKL